MAKVVATESRHRGLNINVRIGVHTGMVMGGVIGTVRFHFDMWGNGIVGAMKMEEMGVKGKLHISDATAGLLGGVFPLVDAGVIEPSFADTYGIRSSYVIDPDALTPTERDKIKRLRRESIDWTKSQGRSFLARLSNCERCPRSFLAFTSPLECLSHPTAAPLHHPDFSRSRIALAFASA